MQCRTPGWKLNWRGKCIWVSEQNWNITGKLDKRIMQTLHLLTFVTVVVEESICILRKYTLKYLGGKLTLKCFNKRIERDTKTTQDCEISAHHLGMQLRPAAKSTGNLSPSDRM